VNPLETLTAWIADARTHGVRDPDAMVLATVGANGAPSARVVLCRGIDDRGLRFYTSYEGRKGGEMAVHPDVAACFHWDVLGKQVRVEGGVERLGHDESEAYFHRRPRGHQLQAWASPQSHVIQSLDEVRVRHAEMTARFEGKDIPMPPHWGGYLIRPRVIELWTTGADRLHERLVYTRNGQAWDVTRLAP
jgi:pyridoxamine 5'-phosphate oxidase